MQQSLASKVAALEHEHLILQDKMEGYTALLYRCYLRQEGEVFNEPFDEATILMLDSMCFHWNEEQGKLIMYIKDF